MVITLYNAQDYAIYIHNYRSITKIPRYIYIQPKIRVTKLKDAIIL